MTGHEIDFCRGLRITGNALEPVREFLSGDPNPQSLAHCRILITKALELITRDPDLSYFVAHLDHVLQAVMALRQRHLNELATLRAELAAERSKPAPAPQPLDLAPILESLRLTLQFARRQTGDPEHQIRALLVRRPDLGASSARSGKLPSRDFTRG